MFGEGCWNDVDNNGVLGRFGGLDPQCQLECETQVRIGSGRVDLELRFTDEGSAEVAIRVEIKHGDEPRAGQLPKYQDLGVAVVLLAPAADLLTWTGDPAVKGKIPKEVARRSWQETGRKIRQFRLTSSLTQLEQWLIDEFLKLLKEEQLMAVEAIGPQHLIAMANHAESEKALEQLLQLVIGKIDDDDSWARDGGEHRGYGQYEKFKPVEQAGQVQWTSAWYEFKASTESSVSQEDSDDLYFLAGISAKGKGASFGGNERAEELLLSLPKLPKAGGFGDFTEGKCRRFMRVATPMSVMRGATIEGQAEAIAEWVIKSFNLLAGRIEI
jgi:hypothetical protein